MPSAASLRSYRNRQRGVRFEREICRRLRAEGLPARRILEYDGFSHGCDIFIAPTVAIQVKNTARPSDCLRALKEAIAGAPADTGLYIAIHRCQRREQILVAERHYNGILQPRSVSWPEMIAILANHASSTGDSSSFTSTAETVGTNSQVLPFPPTAAAPAVCAQSVKSAKGD